MPWTKMLNEATFRKILLPSLGLFTLAQIVSAFSFSRSFTASSIVAMISLLGSILKVIETLRSFARRLVLIWVNCLEDILITHFFLCYISGTLCYFVLSDQFIKFLYMSFLLNQKISYTSFHESFLQDGTLQVL